MKITILESGCCGNGRLEAATREALAKTGLDAQIETVTDWQAIMAYGVMSTPGLVIDGEVRAAGFVPSVDDIALLLSRAAS